jgi:hypothetical protein
VDKDELPAAYVMHPRRQETTIVAERWHGWLVKVHIYWTEPDDDPTRPRRHAYIPLSEESREALIRQLGGTP